MVVTRLSLAGAPAAFAALVCLAFACSSSTGSSSGTSGSSGSSGSTADGGDDGAAPADSGADAGARVVNGCTVGKNFSDHTAATDPRTIDWDFSLAQSPSRCMTIKKGQTVTWEKAGGGPPELTLYALQPSGGDSPNPIANIDAQSGRVTFPSTGIFGYASPDAPALTGAIQVE